MDEKQLDDTILIRQINQRDENALAELYDRYGRLVFSIAYRVVADRQTAEEITLDIFTRVWEKAHTYDSDKSKVSTWLTRMTRNRAIDMLRREQVRPEKHSISWEIVTSEPRAEGQNPESHANLMLEQEKVRRALADLPENQQEVLALAYFKGLSHSEIAAYLGETLGTVKGRIRSGMKALRAALLDG